MSDYMFFESNEISPADLQRVIELTQAGTLMWRPSDSAHAMYADPVSQEASDFSEASIRIIGANLKGVRIGWSPARGKWHYARLTDHGGNHYYVEEGSGTGLLAKTNELCNLARKAIRLGGTLTADPAATRFCKTCNEETEHKHLHNAPYGLAGATMAGSERYTCVICETSVPIDVIKEAA